jgi:4-hydroxybenzoate polyprenyltransferase
LSNLLVLILASAGLIISAGKLQNLLPEIAVALFLTLLYAIPLLPFKFSVIARKAGLFKTMLLAFSWAFITVYLPYQFAPSGSWYIMLFLLINRFLFMLMLCIIFDARDTRVDKIRGLQSLTTLLSSKAVRQIMLMIFAAYLINGIVLRIYYQEIPQIAALLVSGVCTAFVYLLSLKKQGYFFYYFIVDGLMLFSALAAYVASI